MNQAQDGDLVLVWPGYYYAFSIQGKSITVEGADSGTGFEVYGAVVISDIQAGQSVQLRGLRPFNWCALTVQSCPGVVRIDDCMFDAGFDTGSPESSGRSGIKISSCANVSLVSSSFEGSDPPSYHDCGHGVEVLASNVLVQDSDCIGGTVQVGYCGGMRGGHGITADTGSYVRFFQSTATGGNGAEWMSLHIGCGNWGPGGYGFYGSGAFIEAWHSTFIPGYDDAGFGIPAPATSYLNVVYSDSDRLFDIDKQLSSPGAITGTATGVPGDLVAISMLPGTNWLTSTGIGTVQSQGGQSIQPAQPWRILGTIGSSGQLNFETPPILLRPGENHRTVALQVQFHNTETYRSNVLWRSFAEPTLLPCELVQSLVQEFCPEVGNNSTGGQAELQATGEGCVSLNSLDLVASGLPAQQSGLFLCSPERGLIFNPFQTTGTFCLGSNFGVFPIGAPADAFGSMSMSVDLNNMPLNPPAVFLPGETWYFQLWYRDPANAPVGPSSHVSKALGVTLW
ncbi:MAG: hypothetical protein R3E96_14850 [Planctomycetota bacterium]